MKSERFLEQQKMLTGFAQACLAISFDIERGIVSPSFVQGKRCLTESVPHMEKNKKTNKKVPVSMYRRALIMAGLGALPAPKNKKKMKEFFQACRWLEGISGNGQLNAAMEIKEILPRVAAIILRMVQEDVKLIDHSGFYNSNINWVL